MAERRELQQYLGQTIPVRCTVTSPKALNNDQQRAYGFLLTYVSLPSGEVIDHAWYDVTWADLATVSGERIRAQAHVDDYYKASRVGGRYVEDEEYGIGIDDLNDVEVWADSDWQPLEKYAAAVRKRRNAEIKAQKASGTYIWPGTWTYSTGTLCVKAAKSAAPGSKCEVTSRDGMHDDTVVLVKQVAIGVWAYTPVAKL